MECNLQSFSLKQCPMQTKEFFLFQQISLKWDSPYENIFCYKCSSFIISMTRDNFLFNAYIQVAHANAIYNSQCKYDSEMT